MAAVRIEEEAFGDIRYDVLAAKCNLADSSHARGKMADIWRQCTLKYAYVLPESIIVAVLGPNGVEGIIEASLGERVDDGIRICGTKDRIEWLNNCRINGRKGGAASESAKQKEVKPSKEEKPLPPLPFESEAFKAAWVEWLKHRSEKRKPITPTSMKKQFAELLAMGEERAIAALSFSITKGYEGIFEDKPKITAKSGRPSLIDETKANGNEFLRRTSGEQQ